MPSGSISIAQRGCRREKKGSSYATAADGPTTSKAVSEAASVVVPTAVELRCGSRRCDLAPVASDKGYPSSSRHPVRLCWSSAPNSNAGVARFVRRFGLGEVCYIEADAFHPQLGGGVEADCVLPALSGELFGGAAIRRCSLGKHLRLRVLRPPKPRDILATTRFAYPVSALERDITGLYFDSRPLTAISVHSSFVGSIDMHDPLRNAGYRPDGRHRCGRFDGLGPTYVRKYFAEARSCSSRRFSFIALSGQEDEGLDFIVEEKAAGAKPGRPITFNVSDDSLQLALPSSPSRFDPRRGRNGA